MKFESPLAAALNHLLDAEPWARERLLPFAAETLELRAPPAAGAALRGDRRRPASAPGRAAGASLVITFGPGALAAALKGEDHLLRAIDVAGNARWRAR